MHNFVGSDSRSVAICALLMSPVLTVTLKGEQVLSHSGGGASVHVFLPLSWACQDDNSTLSSCSNTTTHNYTTAIKTVINGQPKQSKWIISANARVSYNIINMYIIYKCLNGWSHQRLHVLRVSESHGLPKAAIYLLPCGSQQNGWHHLLARPPAHWGGTVSAAKVYDLIIVW